MLFPPEDQIRHSKAIYAVWSIDKLPVDENISAEIKELSEAHLGDPPRKEQEPRAVFRLPSLASEENKPCVAENPSPPKVQDPLLEERWCVPLLVRRRLNGWAVALRDKLLSLQMLAIGLGPVRLATTNHDVHDHHCRMIFPPPTLSRESSRPVPPEL